MMEKIQPSDPLAFSAVASTVNEIRLLKGELIQHRCLLCNSSLLDCSALAKSGRYAVGLRGPAAAVVADLCGDPLLLIGAFSCWRPLCTSTASIPIRHSDFNYYRKASRDASTEKLH